MAESPSFADYSKVVPLSCTPEERPAANRPSSAASTDVVHEIPPGMHKKRATFDVLEGSCRERLDYSSNDIILNRYFLQTCESGLGGEVGEYQTSRFLCKEARFHCNWQGGGCIAVVRSMSSRAVKASVTRPPRAGDGGGSGGLGRDRVRYGRGMIRRPCAERRLPCTTISRARRWW